MTFKLILSTLAISLILIGGASFVSASEVSGSLSSSGGSSATAGTNDPLIGPVSTGSQLGGTVGNSGNTVTGSVTSVSGGGGSGGGGITTLGEPAGLNTSGSTLNEPVAPNPSGSVLGASVEVQTPGVSENGQTSGSVALSSESGTPTFSNANQIAAVGGFANESLMWLWWVLLLVTLLIVGYYLYERYDYSKNRSGKI